MYVCSFFNDVNVYVYVYVCVSVCMYACMRVCVHVWACMHVKYACRYAMIAHATTWN